MVKKTVRTPEGLLKGKVAIVTGGASGIGKAIALEYAKEGAKVAVFDISSDPETIKQLEEAGIAYYTVDVTNRQSVQTAVDRVQTHQGPINILVNNAAIDPKDSLVTTVDDETWDKVMATNVKGPHILTQTVAKKMVLAGVQGSIIFISSIHTKQAFVGDAPYDASKGAVVTYMQNVALELGPHGIRANAIAPGLINGTGMSNVTGELLKQSETATPLGRAGTPQDIANWAVFLASDKSSFTTGQEIRVDGGVSIKSPLPF